MKKRYRILYGSMLLALGMSYIIGIILCMMSVPFPFQNSPSAPAMSLFPFAMMCLVGVFMVMVWIGMSGDESEVDA
jgi:hypothetical protein